MISPELLRRFNFFGYFDDAELKKIALISEQNSVDAGGVIFHECDPAAYLYLLVDGAVDLVATSEEQYHPKERKEFLVGEINPGEIFSVSATIKPFQATAGARAARPSTYIQIDAVELRKLFDSDPRMGYIGMQQIAKALVERLTYTRFQLAAAWS